jgi:hypothetical protein
LVFTAADRVAKRKPRKPLKPRGVTTDAKDRAIIELVVAFGYLSRFQLAELLRMTPVTVHRRAHRLSGFGLLDDRSRGVASEVLFVPTRRGMRLVGMANGFKVSTPTPQTMNHSEGLVALALRFGEAPIRHGLVITEREIEAAVITGALSARIQRQAPWAQAQFSGQFTTWKPIAAPVSGGTGYGFKRPDMLLIKEGLPPVAVELELTQKSSVGSYVRIFESYDKAIKAGHFAPQILYVTAEVAGNHSSISRALIAAHRQTALIHKLSVEFVVLTIGVEFWFPRSARNGWFRQAARV